MGSSISAAYDPSTPAGHLPALRAGRKGQSVTAELSTSTVVP